MIYYALLLISSLLVLVLAIAIFRKTHQAGFVLGFGFIYYWTLYGAWLIVSSRLGYGHNYKFDYLFYKLFPIYLDEDYLWSLVLYTFFIVVAQATVLYWAKRPMTSAAQVDRPIYVAHSKILAMSAIAGLGAFALIRNALRTAVTYGVNGYAIIAANQSDPHPAVAIPLFSVYQLLHEAALASSMIGLSILLSGQKARYVIGKSRPITLIAYLIIISAIYTLNLFFGNRTVIMFAAVSAGLFYFANTRRPNKLLLTAGAVLALAAIVLPGIARSGAESQELLTQSWGQKITQIGLAMFSPQNEAFAAHVSLYGILHHNVSLTYGSSLFWLMESVIPRVIRPEVVPEVYVFYARGVGASAGQGFTVHHAAGWYLNFGVAGVIIGAFIFGWIWAKLFNNFHEQDRKSSHARRVFAAVAFWNFTAYVPQLIRNGVEGYKSVAVEALIIPTCIMILASMHVIMRANRPRFVPTTFRPTGFRILDYNSSLPSLR